MGKTGFSPDGGELVRIVYCDYRPFYFKGGNGDIRGIFVDFWRLWSKKTGRPVSFSMTTWEESIQRVRNGRADINAGIFHNNARERFLDFSIPFFNIPAHIYHRPGIRPSPLTLKRFRLGTVKGAFSSHFLKTQWGANAREYLSHEQMITHALEGDIDAFIMESAVASSYLAKHDGLNRLSESPEPIYTQPFRAGVKKGNTDLLSQINLGFSRISPKEISAILDSWTGSPPVEVGAAFPNRVVIATSVDQQPFHFVDEKGEAVGMLIDLWRLWGKKNNTKIEFKSGTWSESLSMVRDGRADIHAGCFFSKDREAFLEFAVPLTPCDTHFFFHKSVFGLKSLEDLIGFKIGVLENDFAVKFIQRHLPGAYIEQYPSNQALFEAVKKGDIKVFVGDTPTALFFLAEKQLQSQYRHHPARPLYTNTYFGAVKKGNAGLVASVKKGFSAISAQEKAAVERKWTGRSHHNTEDVLVIACEKDFPPYSMLNTSGNPTGILIDFWRLWSKKTGRTVEFRVLDRHDTEQALVTGQADVLAGRVEQEDLSPMLSLSQPVYRIDASLFYRADLPVGQLDDVAGQDVAAVRGSPTLVWLSQRFAKGDIRLFDSEEEMTLAAAGGQVDFFVGPSRVMQAFLDRHGLTGAFASLPRPLFSRNLCGAVIRSRPDRLSLVNAGIAGVSQEEMARITANWIPGREKSNTPYHRIVLTENEQTWLNRNHTIRLGFPPNFPPFDFTGKEGAYMGITSEYVKLLNQRLNIRVKIVPGLTWSQVISRAKSGKRELDMVSSAARTDSVTAFMLLTDPYTKFSWVIITRRDTPLIGSLRDLYGKSTGVLMDFAMHERLKQDHPQIPLVPVKSVAEGMAAVSQGRVDAYVGNLGAAGYAIQNDHYSGLKIAASTNYGNEGICFAVRSDWPELVSIINKGLATISGQERDRIRQRWFSVRFDHGIDRAQILNIVLGIGVFSCVLILLVVLWNRHIHRARAAAEAANKAKSEFLASLSHEIRTPMNVIMGMTDLTLGTTLTKDQRDNMKNTREAAGHLLELIDDILDLSKIEAGKVKVTRISFDLNRLLGGIIRIYKTQAVKKGLELILEKDDDVPDRLKGDPIRLRQILVNLIGNAIKFTENGEIKVRVQKACDLGQKDLSGRGFYRFSVHDTGIGISPDKFEIIFDSFTRVGRSAGQRGTGLGLAICKRFAGLMGGRIRVESTRGQGSSFFLDIPFPRADPSEDNALAPPGAPFLDDDSLVPIPAGISILLAEDSGPNAVVAKGFIRELGHDVTHVRSGTQVLKALRHKNYDLVFMDVEMPEIDGLEATRRIRSGMAGNNNKDIPVVAVTAHALDEYRKKCLDAGMDEFLTKPIDKATFARTLSRHCRGNAIASAMTIRLDKSGALARCGGSEELLREVWNIFAQEIPKIMEDMDRAVDMVDLDSLLYTAHNLKGASDRIGAQAARDIAAALEQSAKDGDTISIGRKARELSLELTEVMVALTHLSGKVPLPEKDDQ